MVSFWSALGRIVLAAAALAACTDAVAVERTDACVKYETQNGWSNGYSVEATLIGGSELNQKVGSYTRFSAFATYAVIFWGEGQASILELPGLSFGKLPIFESDVNDEEGKRWRIKEGHSMCY